MRRFAALALLMFSICAGSSASGNIIDIHFSPGGTNPGQWSYDGVDTLSFSQMIDVDLVLEETTDSLFDEFVYVPDLVLSSGNTIVTPNGPVEIKDSGDNLLFSGTLSSGDFIAYFTIAGLYVEYKNDITVTYVNNTIGSDWLDEISIGTELDFSLSLQCSQNFSYILDNGIEASNGFSGSMDIIPEPTTIALFGLGALSLVRRKRSK